MELNVGDEVTINAQIINITANGNPVIKLKSGIKFLIKPSDIVTICPYLERSDVDMRRGN